MAPPTTPVWVGGIRTAVLQKPSPWGHQTSLLVREHILTSSRG